MATVNDNDPRVEYTATASQTTFTRPFFLNAEADLDVYANGVLVASGYTHTGVGDNSGTIVFSSGRTAGDIIILSRSTAQARSSVYSNGQPIPASSLEDDNTRALLLEQEAKRDISRAIRAPITDTDLDADSLELPAKADRASKFMVFAADGKTINASAGTGTDTGLREDLADTVNAGNGDSLVGMSRSLPGAVASTLHAFNEARYVDPVVDFGAAGDGVTDDSVALQAAIDSGYPVYLGPRDYAFGTTLEIPNLTHIYGVSPQSSRLLYTGAGKGFVNPTPGTRIFGWVFRDFRLEDTGTGTVGIEMDSVSSCAFYNVAVANFDLQFDIYSPTSGFSVYNHFDNCLAQGASGYRLRGTSSNSNTFVACRTNLATVRGVEIVDSNDNSFIACQFESGNAGTAVYLTATGSGLNRNNKFIGCRTEGYTGGIGYHIASVDVAETAIIAPNVFTSVTTPITDAGTRTQVILANGSTMSNKEISALSSTIGTPWVRERTSNGGSSVPMQIFRDSATATGTPVTVQIETERSAGSFMRGQRGGVTYVEDKATGQRIGETLVLKGATPTVAAGEIGFGDTVSTTVGAAGGAAALPATPSGYLTINIEGTAYKVPYYAS